MEPISLSTWRLVNRYVLPPIFLAQFISIIDRVNLSFAALQMNKELSFGPEVFGFGASIFFISYSVLEVPSNFALMKVGVRRWLARIMITWGLAACAMALVNSSSSFYLVRFLIGAAEAGLGAGVFYYLRFWYLPNQRARAVAMWLSATMFAFVLAGPISTSLMSINAFGVHGWQWMFLLEGIPAIILGILFPWILPERPENAAWLPEANRLWLTKNLALAQQADTPRSLKDFLDGSRSSAVWLLAFTIFCFGLGGYALNFWLPQMFKTDFGRLSTFQIGLVTSLPYFCALIGMNLLGRQSDRTGERRWHLVILGFISGFALIAGVLIANPLASLLLMCVVITCTFAWLIIFMSVPMTLLTGTAAAASGLAIINGMASLGGIFGPSIVGLLKGYTGTFQAAICALAAAYFITGIVPLVAPRFFARVSERAQAVAVPVTVTP